MGDESARTGESLNLFPYYIDASIITSIELEHHLSHILIAKYPSC